MIKASRQYLKDECAPRWKEILKGEELWISFFIGVCCFLWGQSLPISHAKGSDFITLILAYAAIVLGFCLAGMTLALTLPSQEFAKYLAKKATGPKNTYSDLLFVFSWTAVSHWMVIVIATTFVFFKGLAFELLPTGASFYHRFSISVMTVMIIYGLLQFLICVISLSQVGNIYINQTRSAQKDGKEGHSEGGLLNQ
jgi:hypothetical protein